MKDPRVDRIIELLIDYFAHDATCLPFVEKLQQIRDEAAMEEVSGDTESSVDWKVGDEGRLKREHWSHSRGLGGSKGKVKKVNRKTLKMNFENRFGTIGVPIGWVELFPQEAE